MMLEVKSISGSIIQRESVGVLDLAEYKRTVEGAYAVKVAEDSEQKLLIRFHVARIYLEQKIVVAGNVVTFSYLGNAFHRLHDTESIFIGVLLHLQITECDEAAINLLGIENGYILAYKALALKPLYTLIGRSRGKMDRCGKPFDGKTRIVL